jgi:hypothetical protein
MTRIALVGLLGLMIANSPQVAWAQTGSGYATKYFLDEPPTATELSALPVTAQDVLVAKVRIVGRIIYCCGRHPWDPPQPRPKTVLRAELNILEILRGSATKDARYFVSFIALGSGQRHKYPHTPPAYARDYYIAAYLNEDNEHQLVGFPEDEETYERWDRERSEHERKRGLPGAPDP